MCALLRTFRCEQQTRGLHAEPREILAQTQRTVADERVAAAVFGQQRKALVPAVGQLFEKQAALKTAEGVLDGLRQTVTEAAVGMSESIAFSMLVVLFSVLFGRLIWIFGRSLKLIVRRTPLSALDSAGGALIGFVTGVAFVCILLIVLQWLFPITYTSLGYLSPERVKHTLLLKQLVDVLPIAI